MQPLVEALRSIGAEINYLEKEGFAPLYIQGKTLHTAPIKIDGKESSQFASSLLLIAPFIKEGLTLQISKDSKSLAYLGLTLETLGLFGAKHTVSANKITIPQQALIPPSIEWPCDWSSVPYFLAIAACCQEANILVKKVSKAPSQADFIAVDIFKTHFGIACLFEEDGLRIRRSEVEETRAKISLDGSHFPDLAPTIICCAAVCKRDIEIHGIEHLRFKESDRIRTLEVALEQMNYHFSEIAPNRWYGTYKGPSEWPLEVRLATQNDHRMAMSLSLFALTGIQLTLTDASCIEKSFPHYWQMLSILGISYEIT
jgi:3-phosphoshikimate 1-carboxyvinyltransferase